jgi:hypothetical protein
MCPDARNSWKDARYAAIGVRFMSKQASTRASK